MTASTKKQPTTLTDLPPELWDHITNYLPTASSVASLGKTSKSLHAFVEKDAWKSFSRNHFPSLCPTDSPSFKDTARTLTTLSRAWDRRAFVGRYLEPRGDITAYPGKKAVEKWKRPRGQTIGFTPQLDVYEEVGPTWRDRKETLAFSAGAEICLRQLSRSKDGDSTRWTTYRPLSAAEGRDDVTTMHLVRPEGESQGRQDIVSGTANGDLHLLSLPTDDSEEDVKITYFATQGLPVRSSSLLQEPYHPTMLAANLGDARIALYRVDSDQPKIVPSSQFDMKPVLRADGNPAPNHRAWSTTFLSAKALAVGAGPSESPIHIHPITESGLSRDTIRKFSLQNDLEALDGNITLSGFPKKSTSSVYTTVPFPSSTGASGDGNVFLSGAYDGIVRLHDLRSNREVEAAYVDPADDSAIYSILPRGQEKLVAGTSRHNLLKIFDLRLGAKCYSYLDADPQSQLTHPQEHNGDYNVFLRANNSSTTARGSGWQRNRTVESSIYSLASPSSHSPYIYAGVENAIMSLAFTEIMDAHPDPSFFEPWSTKGEKTGKVTSRTFDSKDVLGLAMYDQGSNMKLHVQRSPWETWRARQPSEGKRSQTRLDERWKGANEFGP